VERESSKLLHRSGYSWATVSETEVDCAAHSADGGGSGNGDGVDLIDAGQARAAREADDCGGAAKREEQTQVRRATGARLPRLRREKPKKASSPKGKTAAKAIGERPLGVLPAGAGSAGRMSRASARVVVTVMVVVTLSRCPCR